MFKNLFNTGLNQEKESITPHKICVAILIRCFCLYRESGNWGISEPSRYRILPPVMTPIQRRDFCIVILKLIQSPDLTLPELRNLLLSENFNIDRRFVMQFDIAIRDLYYVGVSNLLDRAEHISRLTFDSQPTGILCQINKNSILGCYLRRLMIYFDKLTFSEVTAVYESFKQYYKPCELEIKAGKAYDSEILDETENIQPSNFPKMALFTKTNHWSKRQAELYIATQSALLSSNEVAANSPKEINKQISCLLKSNPDLAEAHFLSYMNYLRVKEFCGAIDSLYHAFDKSSPICDNKSNNNAEDKLKGLRYAALNLAVLHVQFDHKEEALAALKESINMAQEANDNICLQHALTWLYKLTNTNKGLLMQHSILKSKNFSLPYIASLGVQSYAQHVSLAGTVPKYIFEIMITSDILNCENSFRDLMSNSYSQKSSLWLNYGKTEMSSLWSQLLLHLNSDNLGKTYNGEGTCQSICRIANIFLLKGDYAPAGTILQLARKKFPNEPVSHNWMLCECLFSYVRSIHNGNWADAEASASQMAALDKWESCLKMAELAIVRGDFQMANNYANFVIHHCEEDPSAKLSIRYKILAEILLVDLQCSSASSNLPSTAIPILTSALSSANLYNLDYLSSIIHMHLANIQLIMGLSSQALKILDKHLVEILTHGGRYDCARALLLYVKCLVADVGGKSEDERLTVILTAVEILKKVKEDFHKVEARSRVKDVLYLQAQLYNEIDHLEERNDCALEYKQYNLDYPTKTSRTLVTSF